MRPAVPAKGVGNMNPVKRQEYNASEYCPVCGSRRSGYAATRALGSFPVTRSYFPCGYTVTAAGTSTGRMLVLGVGCKGRKAVN